MCSAADALAALIKIEADMTAAERHLNQEMDMLLVLCRQLADLLSPASA